NQIASSLHASFRHHATNTCQPSHIEQLVRSYGGTTSRSARRFLSLMTFFRAEERTFISLFLARWSPSPDTTVTNALDLVQNSDSSPLDVLAFSWRRPGEEKGTRRGPVVGSIYDPLVVITLSA
ncbi:hypothetical protein PAXRUDRAFT_132648, partial [Paxillus rubicundulus Ve08.2h10]